MAGGLGGGVGSGEMEQLYDDDTPSPAAEEVGGDCVTACGLDALKATPSR